jgi:hypothetical protein
MVQRLQLASNVRPYRREGVFGADFSVNVTRLECVVVRPVELSSASSISLDELLLGSGPVRVWRCDLMVKGVQKQPVIFSSQGSRSVNLVEQATAVSLTPDVGRLPSAPSSRCCWDRMVVHGRVAPERDSGGGELVSVTREDGLGFVEEAAA